MAGFFWITSECWSSILARACGGLQTERVARAAALSIQREILILGGIRDGFPGNGDVLFGSGGDSRELVSSFFCDQECFSVGVSFNFEVLEIGEEGDLLRYLVHGDGLPRFGGEPGDGDHEVGQMGYFESDLSRGGLCREFITALCDLFVGLHGVGGHVWVEGWGARGDEAGLFCREREGTAGQDSRFDEGLF